MPENIEKLVAELRDERTGLLAAARNIERARNSGCVEYLAGWEHLTTGKAVLLLEALSRPGYAEGIEAAAKVAESWISSLRPGSIDRMNGQLEARREIASRIRALRDTNHA